MINLRYHVVSITAVFLALGIGLTLGSSFLDRVTVDNLKHRLDAVQERVEATERENDLLAGRVGAFDSRDAAFVDELSGRILQGHLDAVPVLLVATEGTDEALVTDALTALSAGGAQVAGTWWLTDMWLLEDPGDAERLASLLGMSVADNDRLRRAAALRVAEQLANASGPPTTEIDRSTGQPVITEPPAPSPPATEPELIAGLEEAGFIRYEALPGSGDDRVLLPGASARYVVVSTTSTDSGSEAFAVALLTEMVSRDAAPVVAAQGLADLPRVGKTEASDDDRRTTFVGPLRKNETTRERLSTIDDLDTAAGLVSLILAVEDLGAARFGHFGVAPGASTLLPGADTTR
ncbi:MAG: copper transporter [Acidimicrobiales bacterium]